MTSIDPQVFKEYLAIFGFLFTLLTTNILIYKLYRSKYKFSGELRKFFDSLSMSIFFINYVIYSYFILEIFVASGRSDFWRERIELWFIIFITGCVLVAYAYGIFVIRSVEKLGRKYV